ncbi:hypothetical protein Aduo_002828 [Ancylostoma duodenale]
MWIGLFAAVVSSVLFGSVFVPIKRVAAGDGFTAQLFMCIGAFAAAAVWISLVHSQCFCYSNHEPIGYGAFCSCLECLIVSCLTGWATSRYGLFGLPAAIPAGTVLNYLGIVGLIAGGSMYLFVKNDNNGTADIGEMDEKGYSVDSCSGKNKEISVIGRALSFLSAMLSGLFYGTMWLPISYIRNHPEEFANAPTDSISYLFSFFCGVMCTSVCIFGVYCFVKHNRP